MKEHPAIVQLLEIIDQYVDLEGLPIPMHMLHRIHASQFLLESCVDELQARGYDGDE